MSKEKIYLLEYCRDIDLVTWEYQNLSDTDRTQVANLKFRSSIDFITENGDYNMLIIAEENEFNKLKKILNENYIHCFYKELTKKLLSNKTNIDKITQNSKNENTNLYESFKQKLEEWIMENLDLDVVLDMINDIGIENIREIDKQFLANYGK